MSSQEQQKNGLEQPPRWTVRPMRQDDIQKCLAIWKEVELTEAHQTVSSALETDPDGFYVAELVPSGE